jgi:hypothetical protein
MSNRLFLPRYRIFPPAIAHDLHLLFCKSKFFAEAEEEFFFQPNPRVCVQKPTRIERSSAGGEMQRRRRERGSETAGAFDEAAVRCQICLKLRTFTNVMMTISSATAAA